MTDVSKKTILIVEDETAQRKALVDKFTREGFDILEAKDGEEGLSLALKEQPTIILLDVVMPKKDGMTMLRELRQKNDWGKNVPVILLTNLGIDDEKINTGVVETEPAFYLMKANFTMDQVVEKVKERLSQ